MSIAMAELLLADGRFPAGGHAHSGGVEAAVAGGRVRDEVSLEAFVIGRLATVGLTEAALAAATHHRLATFVPPAAGPVGSGVGRSHDVGSPGGRVAGPAGGIAAVLGELDAEADARITAPPLRDASRKLGRQLLRVAGRCWPDPLLAEAAGGHPQGLHQPVALGAVGMVAGLDAGAVARLAVHHAVTTPAQAAVRLLGLDPFGIAALTAALVNGEVARSVIIEALVAARGPLADLPARSAPLLDLDAVDHRRWDMRLFAT